MVQHTSFFLINPNMLRVKLLLVLVLTSLVLVMVRGFDVSSWMGGLWPVISNLTLLDLSVVGTHDSLTYDLSDRFADNDLPQFPPWLAALLHNLPEGEVGEFVRRQAVTQNATLTEQLDGGARFIDFRITFSRPPSDDAEGRGSGSGSDNTNDDGSYNWYGVHTLETRQPALTYLAELKEWLVSHPTELVVVWLSRHSSTCATGTDQFPGTTPADRQACWLTHVFVSSCFVRLWSLGTNCWAGACIVLRCCCCRAALR